jgi:hypothetical protein
MIATRVIQTRLYCYGAPRKGAAEVVNGVGMWPHESDDRLAVEVCERHRIAGEAW